MENRQKIIFEEIGKSGMSEMEEEDGDRVHALTFLQHCSQMHRIPPETHTSSSPTNTKQRTWLETRCA